MSSKSKIAEFLYRCLPVLLCIYVGSAALASTYYVSTGGSDSSSGSSSSPWATISHAGTVANAGDTVIVENGSYDLGSGVTMTNQGTSSSLITFQAQNWHGATITYNTNTAGALLVDNNKQYIAWQGFIFDPGSIEASPSAPGMYIIAYDGWQFLDCEFLHNTFIAGGASQSDGTQISHGVQFQRCVFSDLVSQPGCFADSTNMVDNVTFQDVILRRSNRENGDTGDVGDKWGLFTRNFVFNDLIDYDNNGNGLWFDTDNDGWTIENSTFFANHAAGNTCITATVTSSGNTTSAFAGTDQDGGSIPQNKEAILFTSGADSGDSTYQYGSSGSDITVSPALPYAPASGDTFVYQTGYPGAGGISLGGGIGFVTEANDDGTFTNNVMYDNTDAGYWDHSSGGTAFGGSGGLTITDNLFAYDPEGLFVWSDSRDQGPATIQYNKFLFTPGSSSAFDSWGSTPGTYPGSTGIDFDYNDYDATNSEGNWAYWFSNPVVAGGLTSGSQPSGEEEINGTEVYQGYLQNTSTWDQDLHGNTNSVSFIGSQPAAYYFPAQTDYTWSDVYYPSNTFGTSGSIHQIDDTNGATSNTIDGVIDGQSVNSVLTIPVTAHTPLTGTGPYTCEVYDLNGRWVSMTVPTANESAFLAAVPPYVTFTTSNATETYDIMVTLNSVPPYNVTATYNPSGGGGGGGGGSLSGSHAAASTTSTYNLTTLGTSDWAHWNGTYNHKSSGGSQISNVTEVGGGNYGSYAYNDVKVSWSDGTPVTSNSGDGTQIWVNNVENAGWTFTVPADTSSRTLNVIVDSGDTTLSIKAHLSDGSASDYTDTESAPGPTLYTFTYTAASADQTLTITLLKVGDDNIDSVQLDAAWLTGGSGGGVTGSLSGSEATASTSIYNLTSLGTTDWSHWNNNGWIHDSSGGSQISNVTQTGAGSFGNWDVSTRNVSWTNGTPTASNSDDDYYIWCNGTTGEGWTFTAPATTTSHTLYILCGGDGGSPYAATKLNAHLSDGSASDYTSTETTTSSANLFLYTLIYNAASAGQTLTITLTKNDSDSGTSVDLDAAWLH